MTMQTIRSLILLLLLTLLSLWVGNAFSAGQSITLEYETGGNVR